MGYQGMFMVYFVSETAQVELTSVRPCLRLLHHDHGHGDERPLLHEVHRIRQHRLQQCNRLLQAGAYTCSLQSST